MSGLRSSAVFALRRPRLSGARSTSRAGGGRRVDVLDELDLGALEEAVQLLDVGLVQVELGHCALDLGVGEHADLLALGEQALDLFQLLKFRLLTFVFPFLPSIDNPRATAGASHGFWLRTTTPPDIRPQPCQRYNPKRMLSRLPC